MIPRKGRFKAKDNPFKQYRRKHPPLETSFYAHECRRLRLANPTLAELAMEQLLISLKIRHERERIVYYADRFLILDFFIPSPYGLSGIALEIDGSVHDKQKAYDRGRDSYLASIGIQTQRFKNAEVLKTPAKAKERLLTIVKTHSTTGSNTVCQRIRR